LQFAAVPGYDSAPMIAAVTKPPPPDEANAIHFLIHALWLMWPLWVILAVVAVGRLLVELWKVRRLRRAGMFEIDGMSGPEFESKLALLFRSLGYRAEVIGSARGDFGGDLLLSRDGRKTVVQAKCWKKNVGVKAVQEAVAARGFYATDAAMVVTNARLTEQARKLAAKNDVTLWGRDELLAALLKARRSDVGATGTDDSIRDVGSPLATTAVGMSGASSSRASCARCGVPVSVKVRDYCLAHAERFAGLVYCYSHQKHFKRP
jgi:restriction system protein